MAVPKIQSLVVQLRSHKPCQKKKKELRATRQSVALSRLLVCTPGGTKTPGKEEDLLGFSSFLQSSPSLPGGSGRRGDPGQLCPPTPHPHAPWLSSGSQKHFFSSGKQLQIPKPALIPRRSPGSCPPMMLPPPEDRHHPLSSPLSASGGAGQPGPPDRVMRGPCPPDVSTLTPREHSKIRSLGHPRQEPQHACVCAKSLQSG